MEGRKGLLHPTEAIVVPVTLLSFPFPEVEDGVGLYAGGLSCSAAVVRTRTGCVSSTSSSCAKRKRVKLKHGHPSCAA